jgi:acyl-CoA thioester hydrolase
MFHAKEGWQVAENEVLYLSIDLTKRRVAPWPQDILARLAAHRSGEAAKRLSLKPPKR